MEQKEHIATLCALGTIGAAAAGLSFGIDHLDTQLFRSGKRKWPGSSTLTSTSTSTSTSTVASTWKIHNNHNKAPQPPKRSRSQPITSLKVYDNTSISLADSATFPQPTHPSHIFPPTREEEPQEITSSRGSSKSRQSAARIQASTTARPAAERRTSGTSSNWFKRLSSFSSHSASPASSIRFFEQDHSALSSSTSSRPATSDQLLPNKLIKRSASQRGVSHEEAQGQLFRRPATSHQRPQAFRSILSRPATGRANTYSEDASEKSTASDPVIRQLPQSLRPYLEINQTRKRRKSEAAAATDHGHIRTIVPSSTQEPWLTLGHDLQSLDTHEDIASKKSIPQHTQRAVSAPTDRKIVRSLSTLRKVTRRRNVTDSSVQVTRTVVNGTITAPVTQNFVSPMLNSHTFEVVLPQGTPLFNSSPVVSHHEYRTNSGLRSSIAPSDPTTNNSDTDMRVFTDDDDSSEIRSDTAWDSVATRTTNASHTGMKSSDLETIFAERTSTETDTHPNVWNHISDDAVIANRPDVELPDATEDRVKMHGIGIAILDAKARSTTQVPDYMTTSTPPRSTSFEMEDFNDTPVPLRTSTNVMDSSPPLVLQSRVAEQHDELSAMLDDMDLDECSDTEWSPKSNGLSAQHVFDASHLRDPFTLPTQFLGDTNPDNSGTSSKRQSIFDFSEGHNLTHMARPKTVHGKQGDNIRSRSSGRKSNAQLHFRSQSVPVNREGPLEDLPVPSKYQTWKLGHTKVSEEWNDDFDFGDEDDEPVVKHTGAEVEGENKNSIRSVKIPQTIIDKQPSVHLQFGQVQEFMLLVEELKRLRLAGAKLGLPSGNGRKLWEDAESIINLATLNDEEDETKNSPSTVTTADPFAELPPIILTSATVATPPNRGRRATGRRSVSNVSTPLATGRARGESLAQAQHFLQSMHKDRNGFESSPREIEIHHEKKTPFDTQDLKDLVVRSAAITRALKEEIRRADPVSVSPDKPSVKSQTLETMFRVPESVEISPSPTRTGHGLPKSQSAHGYLEQLATRSKHSPFSSPISHHTDRNR